MVGDESSFEWRFFAFPALQKKKKMKKLLHVLYTCFVSTSATLFFFVFSRSLHPSLHHWPTPRQSLNTSDSPLLPPLNLLIKRRKKGRKNICVFIPFDRFPVFFFFLPFWSFSACFCVCSLSYSSFTRHHGFSYLGIPPRRVPRVRPCADVAVGRLREPD
jgi:hypothetical protein